MPFFPPAAPDLVKSDVANATPCVPVRVSRRVPPEGVDLRWRRRVRIAGVRLGAPVARLLTELLDRSRAASSHSGAKSHEAATADLEAVN